jgi:aminoglycoside 6'-N-acetyltransferase
VTRIDFRPIARADFPTLSDWLERPHVARWWADDPALEALEREYGPVIDGADPAEVFIATVDDGELGMIQRYRIADEPIHLAELRPLTEVPPCAMSIDYLIGAASQTGKGLGTAMIREFVERLWKEHPACPCIIVPVHADNRASWRALERCGFVRVAEGELTPDNPADSPAHVISRLDRPSP